MVRLLQAGMIGTSVCLFGCCGGPLQKGERSRNLTIDNCSTIPQGAIPPPPGTYLNGFVSAHAAAAEADDFVIYIHEWHKGVPEPSPFGHAHLRRIAGRLSGTPFPVVVQPELNLDLNEARRFFVVEFLIREGIADAGKRVLVDFPQAEGLYGDEAASIYGRMIGGGGRGGAGGFQGGGGGRGLGTGTSRGF